MEPGTNVLVKASSNFTDRLTYELFRKLEVSAARELAAEEICS
jgi:hypothetical protein